MKLKEIKDNNSIGKIPVVFLISSQEGEGFIKGVDLRASSYTRNQVEGINFSKYSQ